MLLKIWLFRVIRHSIILSQWLDVLFVCWNKIDYSYILIEVKTESDLRQRIDLLESAEYICERLPNKPAPHLIFMKGYTELGFAERVFHLYVRYVGD